MSPVATHADEAAGVRETAGFFGPPGAQLHGVLHAPLRDPPAGGAVLCCSVLAELQESYRLEVLLARGLARRGIAVQRFHYRGCGHSDGAVEDLTFDAMRADALAAADRLAEQTGIARPAFLGMRLGSLVAASAQRAFAVAPLVLWAPALDGGRYFRDAIRAALIHRMARGGEAGPVRTDGAVDALGHPVHPRLRESLAGRTVRDELGGRPVPILLVQLDGHGGISPEHAELARDVGGHGAHVDLRIIPERPAWWFSGGAGTGLARLGDDLADWLLPRMEPAP